MYIYKQKCLKINVITIQQNQVLEIPNDNIDIDPQEIQEVKTDDTIENQELHHDIIEIAEPQDVVLDLIEPVVKVKKPRVTKRKSNTCHN